MLQDRVWQASVPAFDYLVQETLNFTLHGEFGSYQLEFTESGNLISGHVDVILHELTRPGALYSHETSTTLYRRLQSALLSQQEAEELFRLNMVGNQLDEKGSPIRPDGPMRNLERLEAQVIELRKMRQKLHQDIAAMELDAGQMDVDLSGSDEYRRLKQNARDMADVIAKAENLVSIGRLAENLGLVGQHADKAEETAKAVADGLKGAVLKGGEALKGFLGDLGKSLRVGQPARDKQEETRALAKDAGKLVHGLLDRFFSKAPAKKGEV